MASHRKGFRASRLIIVLLIAAVIGYAGYRTVKVRQAHQSADAVLETMKEVIPGLGIDTGTSSGRGRDPLLSLSINNIDIVGCLEIPSIDLMAPVTVESEQYDGFVSLVSGSPVKGSFMLEGDRSTTFANLTKAQPGAKVAFTDIDGVRYNYTVITQFHLKDWDEADNDLMVTFRSDDQTVFVVGCTKTD